MDKSQTQEWHVPTIDGEINDKTAKELGPILLAPFRSKDRQKLRTPRRGAHIIEMGLLLPALMLGILWFVDVGWGFHQKNVFENAVREGARAGSIAADKDVAESIAFRTWLDALIPTRDEPSFTASVVGVSPARVIQVKGETTVEPLVGLMGGSTHSLVVTRKIEEGS